MSYQPVDQIPLQELSPGASIDEDRSDRSDRSDLLVIFTEISDYNGNKTDPEDFLSDPYFQQALSRFKGHGRFSKHVCYLVSAAIFILWLIALIAYSNGNARKVAAGVWHGRPTNQVLLSSRNVTLNPFLPANSNVTFDTYRQGLYFPDRQSIRWLSPAQFPRDHSTTNNNGYYMAVENDKTVIRQADSDYKLELLESNMFEYRNNFFQLRDVVLNPNAAVDDLDTFHLLKSDETRQWRHSSFLLFWLWQPVTGKVIPIQPPGYDDAILLEKLHFAHFSPSGEYLVFGHNHDLYAMDVLTRASAALTKSANRNIFHGKPDWVYEEEVNADEKMVWWSPDLKKMVYATLNDTDVGEYEISYYVKPDDDIGMSYHKRDYTRDLFQKRLDGGQNQYPVQTRYKYPKPGTSNPIVSLHVFDTELRTIRPLDGLTDKFVGDDFILYDAVWVDADALLLKIADRTSTILEKKVYVPSLNEVRFVARTNTSEYHGWVEKTQPVTLVKGDGTTKYLDKVVINNFVELALFDLATAANYSRLLGRVHYDSAVAYDDGEKLVYTVWGTNNNQLFGLVSLEDGLARLVDIDGKFSAYFSPDGHYVQLSYDGPGQPWQKLVNVAQLADAEFELDLVKPFNDVQSLARTLDRTNLPTRVYSTVTVGQGKDAVQLSMVEIFPPNFNPARKHPLLVHAYGGPGSTTVDRLFLVDFQDIVSGQLDAVVLIIDPRGTGSDDWKFKLYAREKMGYWEPRDLVSVVEDYIKVNQYVDAKRTALWGWSYGGFTTLKTLEHDGGKVFKYGMAVAPVTNWLFYDSIYTERYMKSPLENHNYEEISRIRHYDQFKQVGRFLIMHGTADDNVHIQNTLWLLDQLDLASVENYDVHFFPDSDHSIYYHNANAIVYDKLLLWVRKAFEGAYD